MKLLASLAVTVSSTVVYTVHKENGNNQAQAAAACAAVGETLANVYSQEEQDALNAAITAAGGATPGDERAFWLGMKENLANFAFDGSPVPSSHGGSYTAQQREELVEATTDTDGIPVYFDGWDQGDGDKRKQQPSNALNGRDKHTTGETEDCVRQLGVNGWNDAMCSRTWSGAKKKNILMGHVCELRTFDPPMVHTGLFEEAFHTWAGAFLKPNAASRWQSRISNFAGRLRDNILNKPCANENGDPAYTGVTEVAVDQAAAPQLTTICDDMRTFFDTFLVNCDQTKNLKDQTTLEAKTERINIFEGLLNAALTKHGE